MYYKDLTDDQYIAYSDYLAGVVPEPDVAKLPNGVTVWVHNVPGVGHVCDGCDHTTNWNWPLLCPPGVTTAQQAAADNNFFTE